LRPVGLRRLGCPRRPGEWDQPHPHWSAVLEGEHLRIAPARPETDVIVVRARVAAMDELVARMARDDIAVRELAPLVSQLEAAFVALTEQEAGQ
jgi:hypothetical protein